MTAFLTPVLSPALSALDLMRLLPVLFLVLGIVFVVLGIRGLRTVRYRQRHWLRYPGQAVDYVWSESGSDNSTQHWILQWIGADGVKRTARNPHGSSGGTLRSFPFPVEVLVNPDNPKEGQVANGANSGVTGFGVFTAVGALFAIIGAIASWVAFRSFV